MLSINGTACHELGCQHRNSRWDAGSDAWIRQRSCFYCGSVVDVDEPCCEEIAYDDDGRDVDTAATRNHGSDSSSYIQALRDAGRYR
jgi:hypothetical protein